MRFCGNERVCHSLCESTVKVTKVWDTFIVFKSHIPVFHVNVQQEQYDKDRLNLESRASFGVPTETTQGTLCSWSKCVWTSVTPFLCGMSKKESWSQSIYPGNGARPCVCSCSSAISIHPEPVRFIDLGRHTAGARAALDTWTNSFGDVTKLVRAGLDAADACSHSGSALVTTSDHACVVARRLSSPATSHETSVASPHSALRVLTRKSDLKSAFICSYLLGVRRVVQKLVGPKVTHQTRLITDM